MFDWRPLPVPESAARAVARAPSQWLAVLNRQLVTGRFSRASRTSPRHR